MTRRLILIACLLLPGCARVFPDRLGVGATFDAETGECRSVNANLFWALR